MTSFFIHTVYISENKAYRGRVEVVFIITIITYIHLLDPFVARPALALHRGGSLSHSLIFVARPALALHRGGSLSHYLIFVARLALALHRGGALPHGTVQQR